MDSESELLVSLYYFLCFASHQFVDTYQLALDCVGTPQTNSNSSRSQPYLSTTLPFNWLGTLSQLCDLVQSLSSPSTSKAIMSSTSRIKVEIKDATLEDLPVIVRPPFPSPFDFLRNLTKLLFARLKVISIPSPPFTTKWSFNLTSQIESNDKPLDSRNSSLSPPFKSVKPSYPLLPTSL